MGRERLVKDAPFYDVLFPSVGKTVTVHQGRRKHEKTLFVWTAQNGNEGWLVAENCPDDGSLPNNGYTVFSGEVVKKVVTDFFGTHVYLDF